MSETELRAVIADGLNRLNRSHGGRYLSTVARRLGVDRSTVSRWRLQRATAQPEHCEQLARQWSTFFDLDQLLDLHYQSLHLGEIGRRQVTGTEILFGTATILDSLTEEILIDPTDPRDRIMRLSALHLEYIGTDPTKTDSLFDRELAGRLESLREAVSERARQGWDVKMVVSSGNLKRLESITNLVHRFDGPASEIFAYPFALPLVLGPIMIANQTVFISYDHRRWEIPGSAIMIRSRETANWADSYFDELITDAPFRLRRPSGIDQAELERFGRALI